MLKEEVNEVAAISGHSRNRAGRCTEVGTQAVGQVLPLME